jgi:Fe-S cluster assembly iron-binding protein IscA
LGLALDELRDDDESFGSDELTFVVNKELLNEIKPIKIDHVETPMGAQLLIDSSFKNKTEGGCGSCSC